MSHLCRVSVSAGEELSTRSDLCPAGAAAPLHSVVYGQEVISAQKLAQRYSQHGALRAAPDVLQSQGTFPFDWMKFDYLGAFFHPCHIFSEAGARSQHPHVVGT